MRGDLVDTQRDGGVLGEPPVSGILVLIRKTWVQNVDRFCLLIRGCILGQLRGERVDGEHMGKGKGRQQEIHSNMKKGTSEPREG